jgi:hypothetical protein
MSSTHLSGPAIARLLACSRMTVNEHMRARHFGPVLRRGSIHYVSLAGVQRHSGQEFTTEQISRAADGRPGRVLVVQLEE